jgi:Arc/MetJ-type ribon-helix-helix transcriptional regulator
MAYIISEANGGTGMHKIELEITEPMAAELRELLHEGEYSSEADVALIALATFLKRRSTRPRSKRTPEELLALEQQHILDDLDWVLQRKEAGN